LKHPASSQFSKIKTKTIAVLGIPCYQSHKTLLPSSK
jgi:hypothetical protein